MNCAVTPKAKVAPRSPSRETVGVAITPSSAAASTAAFFRSVVEWLQAGYPEGVPGPDRVPLLALLRSTTLSEDEIGNVVDAVDEEVEGESEGAKVDRDVIADFIANLSNYEATPQNIARVAAKLAAAGWPLAGLANLQADEFTNGEASASQA